MAFPLVWLLHVGLGAAHEEIRIVHLAAITGWSGGIAMNEAARLLAERINSNTELLPNFKLVLKPVDTGCSTIAEGVVHELLFDGIVRVHNYKSFSNVTVLDEEFGQFGNSNYVGFIGPGCSHGAVKITRMAAAARKPLISPGARFPELTDRFTHPYFWRTTNSMSIEMTHYFSIAALLGVGRVACFLTDQSESHARGFVKGAQLTGIATVGQLLSETIAGGKWQLAAPDFKGFMFDENRMETAQSLTALFLKYPARVSFLVLDPDHVYKLLCAFHQRGIRGPIFLMSGSYKYSLHKIRDDELASKQVPCTTTTILAMMKDMLFVGSYQTRVDRGVNSALAPCYEADPLSFYDEFVAAVTDSDGNLGKGYEYGSPTADALCMWALALHEILEVRKAPLSALSNMNETTFLDVQRLFGSIDFEGITGRVRFVMQDDPNGLPGPDSFGIQYLMQLSISMTESGSTIQDIQLLPLATLSTDTDGSAIFTWAADPLKFDFTWDNTTLHVKGNSLAGSVDEFPTCAVGFVFDYVSRHCKSCSVGSYFDVEIDVCRPCLAGFYGMIASDGASSCKICPAGAFNEIRGANACTLCGQGQYQNSLGQSECLFCEAGRYSLESGQLSCRPCEPGRYASIQGASECQRCRGTRVTTMSRDPIDRQQWVHRDGADSESWCGCVKQTRVNAAGTCMDCEEGVDCIGMGEFSIKYGYAADAMGGGELSVFKCHGQEFHCKGGTPGQTCAEGREGVSCAQCMRMRTPNPDGTCAECGKRDTLPFIFACLAALLLVIFLQRLVDTADRAKQSPWLLLCGMSGSIFITYVQQLGLVRMISVHWPMGLLNLFRILAVDVELIRLNCVVSASALMIFSLKLCMIGVGIITISVIHFTFVKLFHGSRFWEHHPTLVCALGLFAMIFYISVTSTVLEPLQCLPNPNGKETVSGYQSVVCWQSHEHQLMVSSGVIALLVPLVYLANCIVVVTQFPQKMTQGDMRFARMYMFLFTRYRTEMYWYAPAHMCRSLLLSITPIIRNPVGQLIAMQILTLAHLVSTIYFAPWRVRHATILETLVTLMLVLILFVCGLLVQEIPLSEIVNLGIALICTVGILAPLMMLYALLTYFYKRRRKSFDYFLCHHKAGARCLVRLLRIHFQDMNYTAFLDSDNLSDVDQLFDVIAVDTLSLIIVCSKDILMRPWCVGEIATGMLYHMPSVKVKFMEFEDPTDEFIQEYDLHVNVSVLSSRGIDMFMIKEAIRWLSSCHSFELPSYATKGTTDYLVHAITDVCFKKGAITGRITIKPDEFPSDVQVAVLVDHSNFEITACALVLRKVLIPHVIDRNELIPHILSRETTLPETVESLVILCSAGAFQQPHVLRSLWAAAARPQGCSHVPVVAEDKFRFPTREFLEDIRVMVDSVTDDAEEMFSLILNVFRTIALDFQPDRTEQVLFAQTSLIARRLVNHGFVERKSFTSSMSSTYSSTFCGTRSASSVTHSTTPCVTVSLSTHAYSGISRNGKCTHEVAVTNTTDEVAISNNTDIMSL